MVATTANITLVGEQTIDGITTSASRVLVKNQTVSSQNGIYVSSATAWARATDADTWNELISAYVFVEEGTTQADTGWVCTVDPGGTLGVTAVTWAQFSGAGSYTAGTGLTLTGTVFSLTNPVSIALGGTNSTATPIAGGVGYGTGTAHAYSAAGTSGQVLTSAGAGAPTWTTPTTGTVTSVTGTAPVVSSGGNTPAISMAAATTSVNGYLTSTDWTTFNGKQAALVSGTNIKTVGGVSLLGSGDVGTIGVAYGGTGVATLTGLAYGNGTSAFTAATAAQVVSVISTTAVTNATNATNLLLAAGSGATNYITFSTATTGNALQYTSTGLTFNATTNAITAGISGGTF